MLYEVITQSFGIKKILLMVLAVLIVVFTIFALKFILKGIDTTNRNLPSAEENSFANKYSVDKPSAFSQLMQNVITSYSIHYTKLYELLKELRFG